MDIIPNNYIKKINKPIFVYDSFKTLICRNNLTVLNKYMDHDILDKLFLICTLNDYYDSNNNNSLLDYFSNIQLRISANNEKIVINIDLFLNYFILPSVGDEVIYIDKSQIQASEIVNHKYYELFQYIFTDEFNNKLLIIPICINFIINNLQLRSCNGSFDITVKNSNSYENVVEKDLSTQTIDFIKYPQLSKVVSRLFLTNNMSFTKSKDNNLSSFYPFITSTFTLWNFCIIRISKLGTSVDNYDNEILPCIKSITLHNIRNKTKNKYDVNDISIIRKNNYTNMYVFTNNEKYSIKKFIYNSSNLHYNYDSCLKESDYDNILMDGLFNNHDYCDIELDIETPNIPIKIKAFTYAYSYLHY
jgi:hypothetical protein